MSIKILHIDDDKEILSQFQELLIDKQIEDKTISVINSGNFDEGLNLLKKDYYDVVILDLCLGKPSAESEKRGEELLHQIQSLLFVPIIFFTGLPSYVQDLESEIVRVVHKADGEDALIEQLKFIMSSEIVTLKSKVYDLTKESLRHFFWDFLQPNKEIVSNIKDEVSIGYLLLRSLANSLSKDKISTILKDDKLNDDKANPMEFYIYPQSNGEYENGEILKKDDSYFLVLTPSCDFINSKNRSRKAKNVLLANTSPLENFKEYKDYFKNTDKKDKLINLIESRKSDRYYFLPKTPFLPNLVVDFQDNTIVQFENLKDFNRITKLDHPFAESAFSSFVRYYNRIGSPDIDSEYVISQFQQ